MGRVAGLTPDQTRQRVLDGAAAAFAELGFERARISDIAAAAGLSSGAMYNHFDSKATLLAAVIACHTPGQLDALLAAGDASGLLDFVAARGSQLGRRGPVEAPLMIEALAAARRNAEVLGVLAEHVVDRESIFASVIRLAQTAGEVAEDADPQALARFFLMIVLGAQLIQVMDLPGLNPAGWDSLISRLVNSLREGEKR